MNTVRINLQAIQKRRPALAAALIANAPPVAGQLTIPRSVWQSLRTEHRPPRPDRPPKTGPRRRGPAFNGAPFWAELHRRPWFYTPPDDAAWLESFAKRLPCGDCRRHWRETLAHLPPATDNAPTYFAWTVVVHNVINQLLEKPVMTMEDAERQWT